MIGEFRKEGTESSMRIGIFVYNFRRVISGFRNAFTIGVSYFIISEIENRTI